MDPSQPRPNARAFESAAAALRSADAEVHTTQQAVPRARHDGASIGTGHKKGGRTPWSLPIAVAVVLTLAAVVGYLRFHPKAEALRAGAAPAPLQQVPAMPAERPDRKDWRKLQDDQRRAVEAAREQARR